MILLTLERLFNDVNTKEFNTNNEPVLDFCLIDFFNERAKFLKRRTFFLFFLFVSDCKVLFDIRNHMRKALEAHSKQKT